MGIRNKDHLLGKLTKGNEQLAPENHGKEHIQKEERKETYHPSEQREIILGPLFLRSAQHKDQGPYGLSHFMRVCRVLET